MRVWPASKEQGKQREVWETGPGLEGELTLILGFPNPVSMSHNVKQPGCVVAHGFSGSVHGHLTLLLWVCDKGGGHQSGSREPQAA